MKRCLPIIFFVIAILQSLSAQSIHPDILNKKWSAYWISFQSESGSDYHVYHFRKKISLNQKPGSFIIHVSADSRYKLFINNQLVSTGPARSDIYHWNFETVDIAANLKHGENTIHAIVWNFGSRNPEAQVSIQTAFILQGNTSEESIVNTDKSWQCIQDKRYSPLTPDLIYTFYVAGPGDKVDMNSASNPFTSEQGWTNCRQLSNGLPKGVFEWSEGWMLTPRNIPAMEMKPERMKSVVRAANVTVPREFPSSKKSFSIPAHTKATILIDQGHLTNAYPVLKFSKGKDAAINIGNAEALYIQEAGNNWKAQNQKGNRNETEGKRFVGVRDMVISDGSDNQEFSTLAWRTWRYIQFEIETKNNALTIEDFYGIFTGYPFTRQASINFTNDDSASRIFDVGWRTARLCAAETYMDCPYYEQLQYIGDTRIQALISYYNSGDDRLARQAISQIDHSRLAEGVTLSRFPTTHAQEIPPFSLFWIGMIHDYYYYRNDPAFVKSMIPGIRQLLSFFSRYQQTDGSLKDLPYWTFTDWCESHGWYRGIGPMGKNGNSAMLDAQLLWAYKLASELEKKLGNEGIANDYDQAAILLQNTIREKYWDKNKMLFADTPEKDLFSQHTNALAILSGIISKDSAAVIAEKIATDTSLAEATIYFKYYIHQALAKAGKGNDYMNWLDVWRENLKMGMTTWAEISDINRTRSDCHAWGASPNIEFFRIVLGIDSDAPGFSKVKIQPHLGKLKSAKGSMPHPAGKIVVDYQFTGNKFLVMIDLPKGIPGSFTWNGMTTLLSEGRNELKITTTSELIPQIR
ncbi:alpha-L-rhamnosidase C-terminal domain-containing protein [Pollutibacter soli]|uniref:alpha-L-rhamnosidase-related protein n=1 Tax=Pollutibacter soli TaxID=3034157 RepID=UPI0030136077